MTYTKIPFFLLTFIVFIFSSCNKKTEDELLQLANQKVEEAKKMDNENKQEDAKRLYTEAVEFYKQFINEYPSSKKIAGVYSGVAKIYSDNLHEYPTAIKYYADISAKFPNTKDSKYAMFMTAFIYDEMLKDKEKAKESYKKFIEKYPVDDANEKMSESAKMMLQMLEGNSSIEDIIKQNAGNKTDTAKTKTDTSKVKIKKIDDDVKVPPQDNLQKDGDVKKQKSKDDGTPETKQ